MTAQSLADFKANWDRQVGCPEQYETGCSAVVWAEMLLPIRRRHPRAPACGVRRKCRHGASIRPSSAKMGTPFLR